MREGNVLPPTTLERYKPYNYITIKTMVNYLQVYVLANIYHIKIQQLTVPFITNAGQTNEKKCKHLGVSQVITLYLHSIHLVTKIVNIVTIYLIWGWYPYTPTSFLYVA